MSKLYITGIIGAAALFWTTCFVGLLFIPRFWTGFSQERSITICTWPFIFDQAYLKQFEQETGIRLYITYFESNEELYGKMNTSGGEGYDLLVPTDYMVYRLRREDMLKPLDASKLNFIQRLSPYLRGNYYDPDNLYTVGYFWGVYGVALNKNFFKTMPKASWRLIFEPEAQHAPIAMTDAPREAILLAAQYLFGSIDVLSNPQKVQQVKALLMRQKSNVLLYNEARTEDLLLGGNCSSIAALSPEVRRAMIEDIDGTIEFLMPQEGTFRFVDGFVIPRASQKGDLVYQFLNFMYRPDVVAHHLQMFGSCSPVIDVTPKHENMACQGHDIDAMDFFRQVLSPAEIDAIWIDLMAA